jgi:hypothetical protein
VRRGRWNILGRGINLVLVARRVQCKWRLRQDADQHFKNPSGTRLNAGVKPRTPWRRSTSRDPPLVLQSTRTNLGLRSRGGPPCVHHSPRWCRHPIPLGARRYRRAVKSFGRHGALHRAPTKRHIDCRPKTNRSGLDGAIQHPVGREVGHGPAGCRSRDVDARGMTGTFTVSHSPKKCTGTAESRHPWGACTTEDCGAHRVAHRGYANLYSSVSTGKPLTGR